MPLDDRPHAGDVAAVTAQLDSTAFFLTRSHSHPRCWSSCNHMSYAANDGSDPAVLEPAVALQLSLGEEAGEGNCAFFYGTLMHPAILRRVIANDGSHLEICSAILFVRPVD